MPVAAVERLDVVEPHLGVDDADLVLRDALRRIRGMLAMTEEIVGQEPSTLVVVLLRVRVPHEERVIIRAKKYIRHKLDLHGATIVPQTRPGGSQRTELIVRAATRRLLG